MPDIVTIDTSLAIRRPDANALLAEAKDARTRADFLIIDDEEGLKIATDDLREISARAKEIEAVRKQIVKPIDDCKKQIQAAFKPAQALYDEAISIIKRGIADYSIEQERKAAEERRKAEEAAAEERAALEARARELEAAAKKEEATEEERAEAHEMAQAAQEAAAMAVAVPVQAPKKIQGATVTKKWRGRVIDVAAFLRYVADHPEALECVEVKQGAVDRLVAATGGALAIPGIEPYQDTIIATR